MKDLAAQSNRLASVDPAALVDWRLKAAWFGAADASARL